jgi:hypothetical protein
MTKLEIIDSNQFFTVGITEHQRGVFTPFFQSHEVEDDFEEELPTKTEELALLRLAEIIIAKMDIITAPTEDCEDDDPKEDDASDGDCDHWDFEANGDEKENDMCDEPSISLVGGTLPLKEDF